MSNEQISFQVSADVREKAFAVIKKHGLTPSQALNMFMVAIANSNRIPLDWACRPSASTLQAMREIDNREGELIADEETINENSAAVNYGQRPSASTLQAMREIENRDGEYL